MLYFPHLFLVVAVLKVFVIVQELTALQSHRDFRILWTTPQWKCCVIKYITVCTQLRWCGWLYCGCMQHLFSI